MDVIIGGLFLLRSLDLNTRPLAAGQGYLFLRHSTGQNG
jgi:hypothetical protein